MTFLAIVADCGGTNTRLQLYSIESNQLLTLVSNKKAPGKLLFEKEYANEAYLAAKKTFTHIYLEFMKSSHHASSKVHVMSIGVAGPVNSNRVVFTNNGWTIDGTSLESELKINRVTLMNDFVANGYGLLTLDFGAGRGLRASEPEDVRVIQDAPRVPGAPMACVGAGTGLGEVFLTNPNTFCPTRLTTPGAALGFKGDDNYTAYPTEGGHAEFAPRTVLEFEMLEWLMVKYSQRHRVSVERVVSGRGLANIFEFLCQHKEYKGQVGAALKAQFDAATDLQGKVVAEGDAAGDPVAAKAMEIFIGAYGSEAGVAALKYIPFGGLFLAGGLTPKNLHHIEPKGGVGSQHEVLTAEEGIVCLQDAVARNLTMTGHGQFLAAFRDKGRLSPLLLRVPVYAVMDQGLGQRGAHYIAVKLLRQLMVEEQLPTEEEQQQQTNEQGVGPEPAGYGSGGQGALCFLAGVALGAFLLSATAARKK
mmetsp:Transcript_75069/g.150907  ORF Transcript_75069/g.150907 Transcript_75069/m.150907 type:complete len:476 (-) Transcript_75069:27-1454(-)